MILVAAAFTAGPAQLIAQITPLSFMAALILVFAYFILAAVLPINKIIGKIYPTFRRYSYFHGHCNCYSPHFGWSADPEPDTEELTSRRLTDMATPYGDDFMWCDFWIPFYTKPNCFQDDEKRSGKDCKVFYGAMIAEGVIALIWAAAGMTFFGGTGGLQALWRREDLQVL